MRAPLGFFLLILIALTSLARAEEPDPLAPWLAGVKIQAVSTQPSRHTIHSYYITSPESPDGKSVLFYTSTTPEGYQGEIHILDRASGAEKVIARDITVEDAHRAACQQWICGGERVAFHNVVNDQWMVCAVDVGTLQQTILARDRQLGFGWVGGDRVPMYGCHWKPGDHRDLELANVRTGEITTPLAVSAVKAKYAAWFAKTYGERPVSIFFPVISPDQKSVFFKMASAGDGNYRSAKASERLGMVVFDLEKSELRFLRKDWGHPSWSSDSRTIADAGNALVDAKTGSEKRVPNLPKFRGDHPSISPDGKLYITDTTLENYGGTEKEWGVVVSRLSDGKYTIIHRADNSHGARSWRVSHPHPAFSPDGKRIYFNVNSTAWTQLFVAEAG